MPIGSTGRGPKVSLHADSPMYRPGPIRLMATAVTRRARTGERIGSPGDHAEQALRAITLDAAWQLGLDHDRLPGGGQTCRLHDPGRRPPRHRAGGDRGPADRIDLARRRTHGRGLRGAVDRQQPGSGIAREWSMHVRQDGQPIDFSALIPASRVPQQIGTTDQWLHSRRRRRTGTSGPSDSLTSISPGRCRLGTVTASDVATTAQPVPSRSSTTTSPIRTGAVTRSSSSARQASITMPLGISPAVFTGRRFQRAPVIANSGREQAPGIGVLLRGVAVAATAAAPGSRRCGRPRPRPVRGGSRTAADAQVGVGLHLTHGLRGCGAPSLWVIARPRSPGHDLDAKESSRNHPRAPRDAASTTPSPRTT